MADVILSYPIGFNFYLRGDRSLLMALAQDGRPIALIHYPVTEGDAGPSEKSGMDGSALLSNNYQRGWVEAKVRLLDLFSSQVDNFNPEAVD